MWTRYWTTGNVATKQGQWWARPANAQLSYATDAKIVEMIAMDPRLLLKEHHQAFVSDTGVRIAYRTFCGAVRRLGFTRHIIRSVCYKADS